MKQRQRIPVLRDVELVEVQLAESLTFRSLDDYFGDTKSTVRIPRQTMRELIEGCR